MNCKRKLQKLFLVSTLVLPFLTSIFLFQDNAGAKEIKKSMPVSKSKTVRAAVDYDSPDCKSYLNGLTGKLNNKWYIPDGKNKVVIRTLLRMMLCHDFFRKEYPNVCGRKLPRKEVEELLALIDVCDEEVAAISESSLSISRPSTLGRLKNGRSARAGGGAAPRCVARGGGLGNSFASTAELRDSMSVLAFLGPFHPAGGGVACLFWCWLVVLRPKSTSFRWERSVDSGALANVLGRLPPRCSPWCCCYHVFL